MRKLAFAFALVVAACSGSAGDDDDDVPVGDADMDGISDLDEGRGGNTDTDGDGTPDYQDTDSDGDGIGDSVEAGDADVRTDPYDSDGDGTPDFQDLDSDGNGRGDEVDGTADPDGDGRGNYSDNDDDGDNVNDSVEIGDDPAAPVDTDADGMPDFQDTDSDGDTVGDIYEGPLDYDGDGSINLRDTDADGDCIPDMLESGGTAPPRNSDDDARYDFLDRDSDNDGIADGDEDANCNGVRDSGETSASDDDTDNDGASDLIEEVAGTDPLDATDNPQANGDFVFVVPYVEPPEPMDDDLPFRTSLQSLDMYVVLDRSGSMSTAINNIKANLSTVVQHLTCPPLGNGTPGQCIPDLWAGAATVGYAGTGGEAFTHHVDVQPAPSFSSIITTSPGGSNSMEPLTFGVYAAITGNGTGAVSSCNILNTVSPRTSCTGSPARNAGYQTFGYPCFREGVIPVILLTTDEPPISAGDTNPCPNWNTTVLPIMQQRSAKLVGILGNASGTVETDVEQMATSTGAVDSAAGNAPLVFDGTGTAAAAAIETGIRTLAAGVPLDLNAIPLDDPTDSVDAVADFVHHLETLQRGTPECANGLMQQDTNGDLLPDRYIDVRAGTPVCWKLVPKMNTTVVTTEQPQLFKATISVIGDGITELDSRTVYFLVPPVVDIPE